MVEVVDLPRTHLPMVLIGLNTLACSSPGIITAFMAAANTGKRATSWGTPPCGAQAGEAQMRRRGQADSDTQFRRLQTQLIELVGTAGEVPFASL